MLLYLAASVLPIVIHSSLWKYCNAKYLYIRSIFFIHNRMMLVEHHTAVRSDEVW